MPSPVFGAMVRLSGRVLVPPSLAPPHSGTGHGLLNFSTAPAYHKKHGPLFFTRVARRGRGGSRCGGEERLCLVRFHIRPQERVDARLIATALSLEPVQYLAIEPDGHCRFRLREP